MKTRLRPASLAAYIAASATLSSSASSVPSAGDVAPPMETLSSPMRRRPPGRHVDAQRRDAAADPVRHRLGPGSARVTVRRRQQHHELLAAEAADQVVVAHRAPDRLGHGHQHLVADQVPVLVVDLLEVVQVQQQHRGVAVEALHPAHRPVGLDVPGGRVEQAGLAVGAGLLLELAHQHGAVQHDQRGQHQHRVGRAEGGHRARGERAHGQRGELQHRVVAVAEHLPDRGQSAVGPLNTIAATIRVMFTAAYASSAGQQCDQPGDAAERVGTAAVAITAAAACTASTTVAVLNSTRCGGTACCRHTRRYM